MWLKLKKIKFTHDNKIFMYTKVKSKIKHFTYKKAVQ